MPLSMVTSPDRKSTREAWATALAITWLRLEASALEDEWRMVVRKGVVALEARLPHDSITRWLDAAREAGVRKVVYLGGLGRGDLSPHLASRQEVGEILRAVTQQQPVTVD